LTARKRTKRKEGGCAKKLASRPIPRKTGDTTCHGAGDMGRCSKTIARQKKNKGQRNVGKPRGGSTKSWANADAENQKSESWVNRGKGVATRKRKTSPQGFKKVGKHAQRPIKKLKKKKTVRGGPTNSVLGGVTNKGKETPARRGGGRTGKRI